MRSVTPAQKAPPHPRKKIRHTRARRGYLAERAPSPAPTSPRPSHLLRRPRAQTPSPPRSSSVAPALKLRRPRAQAPSPPRSSSVAPAQKDPSPPRKKIRHTRAKRSVIPALAAGISPSEHQAPPLAPASPRPSHLLRRPRAQTPSPPRLSSVTPALKLRHTRAKRSVIPALAAGISPRRAQSPAGPLMPAHTPPRLSRKLRGGPPGQAPLSAFESGEPSRIALIS